MRRRYSIRRLIQANLYDLWLLLKESWAVLLGFLIVTVIGTLYLRLAYDPCRYDNDPASINCRLSLLESLFETMRMQTLQSGLAFPSDSILGEVLFFVIPLLGLALIFQGVLNFGRLLLDKSSRREAWQIALASTYRNHVIVCGMGRVGMRTIDQLLEAGHEPVAIERNWNSEFVEHLLNRKVPVVLGDAREPLTLYRAGLRHAQAVVAAINDDLLNLEIGLTVRQLHPETRIILRIFNDELDHNLERSIGLHTAFSTSGLAAPTYAAAAVNRNIDVVLHDAGAPFAISQITVHPDSKLCGFVHSLEEKHQLRVLHHISTEGRRIVPGFMKSITQDDRITLLGSLASIKDVQMLNKAYTKGDIFYEQSDQADDQAKTVIVCGLGKVGYRVVRHLYRMQPRPNIVVLCLGDERSDFQQRISELKEVQIITGDARESSVLRQANITAAFSIAALTSNDLFNLQIALAARQLHPDIHVVLRVFSDALASKLGEMFGIRTAYSTSALASPTLAAAALLGHVGQGFIVGGELHAIERIHIVATSQFNELSIAELREQHDLLTINMQRGGVSILMPALSMPLSAGDEITVLASIHALKRIRQSSTQHRNVIN